MKIGENTAQYLQSKGINIPAGSELVIQDGNLSVQNDGSTVAISAEDLKTLGTALHVLERRLANCDYAIRFGNDGRAVYHTLKGVGRGESDLVNEQTFVWGLYSAMVEDLTTGDQISAFVKDFPSYVCTTAHEG